MTNIQDIHPQGIKQTVGAGRIKKALEIKGNMELHDFQFLGRVYGYK